jgi:hypothetical protein
VLREVLSSIQVPKDKEHILTPAHRLVDITAAIPGLRKREEVLLGNEEIDEDAVYELLMDAQALDFGFVSWASVVPVEWRYISTALDVGGRPQKYPRSLHAYYDESVGSTWNFWRVNRLLVLAIARKCALALSSQSSKYEVGPMLALTNALIQQLVDDVCSSVPFLLGYVDGTTGNQVEGQQPRFPHVAGTRPPPGNKDNSLYLAIFHLSGPMKSAMRAPGIAEDQVEWMKEYSDMSSVLRRQRVGQGPGSRT